MNDTQTHAEAHKQVQIIVNGRQVTVTKGKLTFEEIVALDPTLPKGDNVVYTMTYRKGEGNKEGSLNPSEEINIKNGMIFNVTPANKS
jgi:uncharacterized protein YabE (DUF348 family)